MHNKSLNKKKLIKRTVAYIVMTLAVIIIATYVVLFTLGYRLNLDDRQIEQYAMIQFNSTPSGATILIDGASTNIKTPAKTTVPAGSHTITMSLSGYQTWTKTINIESGMLDWINYALLIPEELTVEPVVNYATVYASVASPGGHYLLIQSQVDLAKFDLIDINSSTIKTKTLTIPATVYSEATTPVVIHSFYIDKWDNGERYALIKHVYGEKYEWLVLDTQDVTLTKNITTLFDFAITNIQFSGTSGNVFYALGNSDIRKIDVSAGTISRPLVSNVNSFSIYGSDVICYIGTGSVQTEKIVGLYRDGDDSPYTVKTINMTEGLTLSASVSNYFNEYYVAIANGTSVDVSSGSFPSSTNEASLKPFISFVASQNVNNLSFSPSGQYVFARNGANFTSYDLEYKTLASSVIDGSGDSLAVKWLNNNYIWSDRGGSLSIREFDGANIHIMNSVTPGQAVALTSSGRYIYSINSVKTGGYQLQRVRIVLP